MEADIRIIIEGVQIDSITTNEQGEYEYATEEDYLEQTLDIIIQKEGFERKNISIEIDKAEIKSDILLNKLEKAKQEKTRIFGTIRNSKNRDPVKAASITLSIEGTEITTFLSNEQGEYEYTTEEDYKGQTLNFVIQKEGFIRKDISHEIERFEIKSDILIDEIEIKIKGKICDETDNPLSNASISFSIGDSTIDLVSDKDGSFSFTVGQQFLNQNIGYEVNKAGFKIKSGKLKLIEDLKCINLLKDTPIKHDINRWIRVAAVGIILTGLAIYLFWSPAGLLVPETPQPKAGSITIGSEPQEAAIYLDGSYEGETPKTISGVSAGSHNIKLTKSGYEDYNAQVTVTSGETETVIAVLTPYEHSISNIQLDPNSPTNLPLTNKVVVTFDYATTETEGVRIFVRPITDGSLTPNYAASGSPLYPKGQGKGEGEFTITSKEVTVDQLRFQMTSADQSRVLYESFISVNYNFYTLK